jgi:hypothetical protein
MPHDRRRFLGHAAVAALALVAGGRSSRALAAATVAPQPFGLGAMQRRIGQVFTLEAGGTQASLQLAEVVPLKKTTGYADAALAREQCFTLVFRSAQSAALAEDIYAFSSSGVAPFSAFMSPIRGDRRSYQVVFNRL